MINLSQLESLIKTQAECLENLWLNLKLAQEVHATAESLMIEFTASAIKQSDREKACTDPEKKDYLAARAQRARDRAQRAEENYQKAQRMYNGHLQKYKKQETELQKLKMEHQKIILSRAFQSLSWLSEATNDASASVKELKVGQEEFLNSQFSP